MTRRKTTERDYADKHTPEYTYEQRVRFISRIAFLEDQNRKLQAALDELQGRYARDVLAHRLKPADLPVLPANSLQDLVALNGAH